MTKKPKQFKNYHKITEQDRRDKIALVKEIWDDPDRGLNAGGRTTLSQCCREADVETQTYKRYCEKFDIDTVI